MARFLPPPKHWSQEKKDEYFNYLANEHQQSNFFLTIAIILIIALFAAIIFIKLKNEKPVSTSIVFVVGNSNIP